MILDPPLEVGALGGRHPPGSPPLRAQIKRTLDVSVASHILLSKKSEIGMCSSDFGKKTFQEREKKVGRLSGKSPKGADARLCICGSR